MEAGTGAHGTRTLDDRMLDGYRGGGRTSAAHSGCVSDAACALIILSLLCPAYVHECAANDAGSANIRGRLRGGSSGVASSMSSPLKSFIQRTTASEGFNAHGLPSTWQALSSPAGLSASLLGAELVDEEGDSLMGRPAAAGGMTSGAVVYQSAPACIVDAHGQAAGDSVPDHGPDTKRKSCKWGQGKPVPFAFVCSKLLAAVPEQHQGRIVQILSELLSDVWQHSPDDLVPLVCLLRDQIVSPTLQGVELLPFAQRTKVVADALAKTPEGLRDAMGTHDDDLAATAQKLRGSQRTLFAPPPLTLSRVLVSLRDVAERSDMAQRLKTAKALLVAAGSAEAYVLVKALEGTLRFTGFSQHVIVLALAAAASSAHKPAAPAPAPAPAPEPAAGVGDTRDASDKHNDSSSSIALIWQALSVEGDWRRVLPALVSHGPHALLTALNVSTARRRAAGVRACKLRALQRAEFLEGGGMPESPTSKAEEEAHVTRLQRYAAVTFGLNPSKLSEMETECLIGLLTSPARTRRILVLRNEMLRRARSKIDEGGLEGPWYLSRHEATTGLEAYADAGVGARGGGMRRVPGGGEGGEPGKSEVYLLY